MSLQETLETVLAGRKPQPRLHKPANVLTLDLERVPGRARVELGTITIEGDFWDLSGWKWLIKRRIRPDEVTEWPRTICVAWKWYGSHRMHFASEWDDGAEGMLLKAWEAYDQADVLYGHNVEGFDTKHLNTGWRDLGLPPPTPFKTLDTLTAARSVFGDESMQLVALTQRLGIATKTDKYDVATARAACAGDTKAQRKLKRYNVGDVVASESFVDRLRGWLPTHPHALTHGVDDGHLTCNQCWSDNLIPNGERLASVLVYPMYRCGDCGANVQDTRHSRRVANTRGVR